MAVSVREVAELAGVSIGTVSNVINRPDIVAAATASRVHAAISQLGYVRNDSARQLRAGRSSLVGLVVPDTGNPFFTELARGAEDAALAHGLAVLVGNSNHEVTRERTYIDLFSERRVAGLLMSPASSDLQALEPLVAQGTSVVLVDQRADDDRFSSVSVDDVGGGRLAAGHLVSAGRRRILVVGGELSIPQVRDRLSGAREAAAAAPEDVAVEYIATNGLTVLEGRRVGALVASRPRHELPDAVFAVNDLLAIGLEQAFLMSGGELEIPGDIALIGYDDIAFTESAIVPLSSVRQPSYEIGYQSIELLVGRVDDHELPTQHLRFQPELIARRSTLGIQAGAEDRTEPPTPEAPRKGGRG